MPVYAVQKKVKMKNIMLSVDSWYPQMGGPNVVVANYLKYLSENNTVTACVPSYGKKTDEAVDKSTGVPVMHVRSVYIPIGGFRNCMPSLDSALGKRAKQADLFHAHSPFALGNYFADAAKKYGKPSILTFHTKFKDEFMRYTHSRICTAIMMSRIMSVINKTDYVWTVSNGAAETLREYGYKGDITIIRNGTDMTVPQDAQSLIAQVNEKYGLADQENVLLFVGRVVQTKNLALVFDALKILKPKMDFRLVIVGDGEELKSYRAMTEALGIADRVLFVGEITDRNFLKAFYLRADLFVFPSLFDTASLCPIEAAAFGLPTLLVEGSATSETIKDGFSGYAVPAEANAWAEKIYSALSDRAALSAVRENCRKYVYRSWKDVVQEAEKKYDEILSGRK